MVNVILVLLLLLQLGHSYLLKNMHVSKKVKIWSDEILTLSCIAETHPHSAYCVFVHDVANT